MKVKDGRKKPWTKERREAFKRKLALKRFSSKLTKSGIRHTPLNLTTVDAQAAPMMTIPQSFRDVASIMGRYQRLDPLGRRYVQAQIIKMEGMDR